MPQYRLLHFANTALPQECSVVVPQSRLHALTQSGTNALPHNRNA
jgi:hypothetical protein